MKLHKRIQARLNGMRHEEGATAVEYGLVVSLIAIFIIGAIGTIGAALLGIFNGATAAL
ncbi:Flp family type IVb pilin [Mycetocola sp. 2940]|uniref:Flp family type IVb pilin n=1 Tax=Mycetocola sp. 2940 TaxID=3156452 RepID=UPI0033939288